MDMEEATESLEAMQARREFDRAAVMTFATIRTLRKLAEDYSILDSEASINHLRKALNQLLIDRDFVLGYIGSLEESK